MMKQRKWLMALYSQSERKPQVQPLWAQPKTSTRPKHTDQDWKIFKNYDVEENIKLQK